MTQKGRFYKNRAIELIGLATLVLFFGTTLEVQAQKELPEVRILVSVPNLAFSAIWVAEQLNFFEAEGVRATIVVAGGGSPCLSAVVGRSAEFCAVSSEGMILARLAGAPLIAIQVHSRNLTLGVTVRREIVDRFGLSRESPLEDRLKVLTQLETIGVTSPGAASHQIMKFLVRKIGGDPEKLKFVFLGAAGLPSSLVNNVIDAFAQSPPTGEGTEAVGRGYVLIPLARGEVPELTNYPYEVLVARSDSVRQNPEVARAVARAISRGGALIRKQPEQAKAALRSHRLFNSERLDQAVFDLAFSMIADAMPLWGDMTEEGWQKVIDFATGAGLIEDPMKTPSAAEGVLWTNQFVGKAP